MTLKDLRQIERILSYLSKGTFGLDLESLAVDIWISLWLSNGYVGHEVVKNRWIDAIRARVRKPETLLEDLTNVPEPETTSEDEVSSALLSSLTSLVDRLMECPSLTLQERGLIIEHFYIGKKHSSTVMNGVIEKLQRFAQETNLTLSLRDEGELKNEE